MFWFLLFTYLSYIFPKHHEITVLQTSDVYGRYFGYDLSTNQPHNNGLPYIQNYVEDARKEHRVLLLDNGNMLLNQAIPCYPETIDTTQKNIVARMLNYMDYDAVTIGEQDIKTTPDVYNKFRKELHAPVLAANIIQKSTNQPYFTPYTVITKKKIRVAIIGLASPEIQQHLPKHLWPDLQFEDMMTAAKKWVPLIIKKERPDIIVGLFHCESGTALPIAKQMKDFDVIFCNQDPQTVCKAIVNDYGDTVWIINPGQNGDYIGRLNVHLYRKKKIEKIQFNGELIPLAGQEADRGFCRKFENDLENIKNTVDTACIQQQMTNDR